MKNQSPSQEQLQSVLNLYNHGKLQQALSESSQMLERFPNSVVLYNISGASNAALKRFDAAIDSYKQALWIKPDYAEVHNNMGSVMKDKGDLNEAIDSYKQAIKIKPDYAVAYNNMANALKDKGDLAEALESYQQALRIKPDYAEVHNNMGNALSIKGDLAEAIESYKKALRIKPNFAGAYNNMANAMKNKGDLAEAIESCKQALKIKPDYADAYYNMANAMKDKGDLAEAIHSYKQALKIKPNYASAYYNMANAMKDKGDLAEAIDNYKQALKIKPNYASAYYNMGNALNEKDNQEAAIDSYKQAIKIQPNYADAYSNMGNSLSDKGDIEAAIDSYKQALKIKPNNADAYYNFSLLYLLLGDFDKGFKYYEWRLKMIKERPVAPSRTNLIWDGEKSLNGKHFVVYEEQGLGDIIQFCRYLPVLEQKGANVTFKVKSNLHALLRTLDSKTSLNTSLPEENKIDFESPLMSLPYLLKTSWKLIPITSPYLYADQNKVTTWGEKLSNDSFKIGICWQGATTKIDVGRSFSLSLFEGISKIPNVQLISLHKGEGEGQITNIDFDVTTLGSGFDAGQDAFLDTAGVMMNCDLIITSDTSVAHLAGALGRPTWVALQYVPASFWMLDRSDSLWYPTMTLFRQKSRGDWVGVFDSIEQNLISLLEQKKGQ
ncbi:tetratricopeptide repeat protein [Candidatus Pseudothioglobus singularis]|nr:tetratricopeptide repeat protein [Candidatus Pseudothioglobus singularis]